MSEEEYEDMTEEEYLEEIKEIIVDGDDEAAAEVTEEALAAGVDPLDILNNGLMAGAEGGISVMDGPGAAGSGGGLVVAEHLSDIGVF